MNKKKSALALVIAIFMLLILGGSAYQLFFPNYGDIFSPEPVQTVAEDQPSEEGDYINDIAGNGTVVYILFLGIDKDEERENTMGVFRTDTVAVARIDLTNNKIRVLSIPRDTYTYIPVENKLDKINHAYAYGSIKGEGVEESIKAVNTLLGQNVINYYFLIDMEPIPAIVNEIGGVKVDVDTNMKSGGVSISKGTQILNGDQAQLYLRWRNSPGGDIDRIKHQQRFMLNLLKQQKENGKLLESMQIILKYHDNVESDLSLKQMIGVARFLSEVTGDNVDYYIIPGKPQMINGVSYWVMDKNKTQQIIAEFLN